MECPEDGKKQIFCDDDDDHHHHHITEHLWSSVRFQGYNFQCGKPNHQPSSISSNMGEVC
jgi:hypothetical protein